MDNNPLPPHLPFSPLAESVSGDFVAVRPPMPAMAAGNTGYGAVAILGLDAERVVFLIGGKSVAVGTLSGSALKDGSVIQLSLSGAGEEVANAEPLDVKILSTKADPAGSSLSWIVTAKIQDQKGRLALAKILTNLRKSQHIELCASADVEGPSANPGFSEVGLLPCALPECDWKDLDTSVSFLGRRFAAPMMITGMTGGVARGTEINHRLARAAAAHDIPMGVGSQRIALEHPEFAEIFAVKREVPEVFLIANLGAGQLGRLGREGCLKAVEMIEADALAIHLNILQEVVQVEGDRCFSGIFASIAALIRDFPVPIIIKEVGAGLDPLTAQRLFELGVMGLDTGGAGGTSWSRIEGMRSASGQSQQLGEMFRDWGIPTAHCIQLLRKFLPKADISATGGIRNGHMIAKAVGLGANMAGVGLPLFRAALAGEDAPKELLDQYLRELKTAMICSGSRTIRDLRNRTITSDSFQRTSAIYESAYFKLARNQGNKAEKNQF